MVDQVSLLITKLSNHDVLLNIHILQNTNPMLQCLHLIFIDWIVAESAEIVD